MTTKSPTDAGRFLRKCAQFFDDISEAELLRFLDGSLKLVLVDSGKVRQSQEDLFRRPNADFQNLVGRLRAAESREDVTKFLHEEPSVASKSDLVQLARLFHVRINKHDKRETIEDKIAEAVIGVRLRSEAIHGVNLKGSSSRGADSRAGVGRAIDEPEEANRK